LLLLSVVLILADATLKWHVDFVAFIIGSFGAFITFCVAVLKNNGKFDPVSLRVFALAFAFVVVGAGFFTMQIIQPVDSAGAFLSGATFPLLVSLIWGKGLE